jgi:glycosyltransferase involved in cell wall biosynthesis
MSGEKNILFFTHSYPYEGGVERTATRIGRHLMAHGYKVYVLSACAEELQGEWLPHYALPEKKISSRANVDYFRSLIERLDIGTVVLHGLYFDILPLLIRVAEGRKFRLLAVHHNSPDALLKSAGQVRYMPARGAKGVVKKSLFPLYYTYNKWRLGRKYGRVYDVVDKMVLLSERFVEQFAEIIHTRDTSKFEAIPNMLTFDERPELAEMNKRKKVLYLGRLDYIQKRIDRILCVWREVQERFPDWDLEIVGKGDYRGELEKLAAELGLKNFKINSDCADIAGKLKESSVLCLTSEFEGFALVLTEAQQFGVVPVAYASYLAAYDIITDSVNGYLTQPPFVQEAFERKLSRLMADDALREKMASTAIKSAARFAPEKVTDMWLKLIE